MRLLSLKIESASTCGGLLDGVAIDFGRHDTQAENEHIAPLCLLGPNGSGKSQFLQLLAEIFQASWHAHDSRQERASSNAEALFELEYLIRPTQDALPVKVKLSRTMKGKTVGEIELHLQENGSETLVEQKSAEFGAYLPKLIVGYTSGDNETMSLPFLVSRSGYAKEVATVALSNAKISIVPPDNRLLLIDYSTNLEVLFSSMMLGRPKVREAVLEHARLRDISSCRCIVRLAHSAAPKAQPSQKKKSGRKGIQLTPELELTLDRLKRAATCWFVDPKTETYTFDYLVDDASRAAFKHFFGNALDLYRALHKFTLLNDLAISKKSRERMDRAVKERRFASRLPEPQQEDMVFSFEEVRFHPEEIGTKSEPVDYVALSDGEHQQSLILGAFAMITDHNVLFLLDEPESHFNPQWRVQFVKRLLDLPVERGEQDVLLTSHAPFVPADMSKEQVMIFSRLEGKLSVRQPDIETYGANFDRILEHCFNIRPPISQIARDDISDLMVSENIEELTLAMERLGSSVEKSFVADRLRQLKIRADS